MRILSCASYYGTGSSAVTDFLSEFDSCVSLGDYEFRFVQDPDGICDLEYNLIENYNRHNSGHALKKYKRLVDFLAGGKFIRKYETFFKGNFKVLSYKYIDDLTDYKFKGYWHEDVRNRGKAFYFRKRLINKILQKTWFKLRGLREASISELPKEITLGSCPSEGKFLILTRKYIDDLFSVVNPTNKPNVIVDQLVPPTNLKRYVRYAEDIKVFVVDRDPRDLFILENEFWKGAIIPRDVETFCTWYKITRSHREKEDMNTDKIIFLNFEDMINNYSETTDRMIEFAELNKDEWKKKKHFVPEKSINNTQLWKKHKKYKEQVEYIEKELSAYLYKW